MTDQGRACPLSGASRHIGSSEGIQLRSTLHQSVHDAASSESEAGPLAVLIEHLRGFPRILIEIFAD